MKIQAGKPVTGRDLIGREKEVALVSELLQQGQSVVLIAPRRFGKTSIVLEVLRRLKNQGHFTAYVDIFAVPGIRHLSEQITSSVLANKKLEKTFRDIRKNIGQVVKNVELKQVVEDFEFILKYTSPDSDEWELLSESIDFIDNFTGKYRKDIFCGLDEFGDIDKLDGDNIVKLFRSKIQVQQNSAYIFSGSSESMMDSLFARKNAPFYRLARIIELGYIHKDAFRKYLENAFRRTGIKAGPGVIDEILEFTKGHPYYTQLILQHIYVTQTLSAKPLSFNMKTILEELLVAEKNYLEKLWEEISARKEHRMVTMKIAEGAGSVYAELDHKSINVARTLKALRGSGYVLKSEKGRYELADPLFRHWIREKVLKIRG